MKKNKSEIIKNLPHIGINERQQIADVVCCNKSYVWAVIKGERKHNTALAKKILKMATQMNDLIESCKETEQRRAEKLLLKFSQEQEDAA